jgi:hypothetical protein
MMRIFALILVLDHIGGQRTGEEFGESLLRESTGLQERPGSFAEIV